MQCHAKTNLGFGKPRKAWYVNINGKRHRLSADKDDALDKFYKLKTENPALSKESLVILMDEMIEWTRKNRSAGTYRFYNEHGQQFLDWLKGPRTSLFVDFYFFSLSRMPRSPPPDPEPLFLFQFKL